MSNTTAKNFRYPTLDMTPNIPRDMGYLAQDIDDYLSANIRPATNVLYVAKNGSDSNDGGTIAKAFLTIKAALAVATNGTTVMVKSGDYTEQNPVTIPTGVSVVGDSLRAVTIRPANTSSHIFYVNNGIYISEVTFKGHLSGASAVAFNPTPPVVTAAVGSGSVITYTANNTFSVGDIVTVSGLTTTTGATLNIANMTIASRSNTQFTVTNSTIGTATATQSGSAKIVITRSPYVYNCSSITTTGKGMYIDGSVVEGNKSMVAGQYTQINYGGIGMHLVNQGYAQLVGIYTIFTDIGVLCESGGFCSLIGSDTSFGNYGLKAVGVSGLLNSGTVFSNDTINQTMVISGLTKAPYANNVVTFDNGSSWYTLNTVDATNLSNGKVEISLTTNIPLNLVNGTTTAKFYQNSRITASGHTFEYCGSGIDPATALPQLGGQPIPGNEIVMSGGGAVFFTSTDQKGNFKIGPDLTIEQSSGTISGRAFNKSLFAIMTPYMLALEA